MQQSEARPLAAPEARSQPSASLSTALALSLSAGMLDAFTFVGHGRVFASAMTGNLVLFGVDSVQGRRVAIDHLWPILAFVVGVFAANLLSRRSARRLGLRSPQRAAVLIEIGVLVTVSLLPAGFKDQFLVAFLTVGTAMQNASFRTVGPRSYNSIIMTGNLQNFAYGLAAGLLPYDRATLRGVAYLAAVVVSFLAGATLGALLTPHLGNLTTLVPAAVLAVVFVHLLWEAGG
jgi:uncharacterized membrane protein YoaK (UPF0700 family)